MSSAAHAAAMDYWAHKPAVWAIACNVNCNTGMMADESKGNGKIGGSYGLPRKRGGRLQLGLFLWSRFKLLTVCFPFCVGFDSLTAHF